MTSSTTERPTRTAADYGEAMSAYIEAHGDRKNPPSFEAPGSIVFMTLDSGIDEAFINGTQPQAAPAAEPAPAAAPSPPAALE